MLKLILVAWVGAMGGFFTAALCQAAGRGRELEEMGMMKGGSRRMGIVTVDGAEILKVPDGAVAGDEGFVGITENPFRHGCCDCGLWHRVEWALADREGNEIQAPEGVILALRFSRDVVQTAHFRESKMSAEALTLSRELKEGVSAEEVSITSFGDVLIQDLDRDSLLRIITLLAAGKRSQEPSRIIRV